MKNRVTSISASPFCGITEEATPRRFEEIHALPISVEKRSFMDTLHINHICVFLSNLMTF